MAADAIKEMYRQRGNFVLDDEGMLTSGVLIRHLILPGQELNSMDVIDFVAEEFEEDAVLFSLMSQYTPMPGSRAVAGLERTVNEDESELLRAYMERRGIVNGYWQGLESAGEEEIPDFDGTGV